jgi:hypothetical protein
LFGRELLQKVLCWGVGNGESIKIAKDKWIPNFLPGTFSTLEPIPKNANVNLFLDENGAWDMDTIRYFFTEEMADIIQRIHIRRYFSSWPHARFGIYTARSASNLAKTNSFFVKRELLAMVVLQTWMFWKRSGNTSRRS